MSGSRTGPPAAPHAGPPAGSLTSPEDRWFTRRQVTAFVTALALAAALGTAAYQAGERLAGTAGGAVVTAATGTVPDGGALYAGNCAGCHGADAGGALGPALSAPAGWSAAGFTQAVLHGRTPDGRTLSAVMPRFDAAGMDGSAPTQAQLNAIQAYLNTRP
ncbi:c-type cytochrome [Deinococcus sp. A31D244]|uniref:c-type cytochrome n=1 Tax=Deinococcus sp. A31D244 TaxID=3397675 RepID=UPI0039E1EB58